MNLSDTTDRKTKALSQPKFDGSLDGFARLIQTDLESASDARCRIIELLRAEEDMVKLCETADRHQRRDRMASLDTIVRKAGINPSDAFGAMSRVLHRYSFDVSQAIIGCVVAARSSEVALAMAEAAVKPDGIADRRLFMEVAGVKRSGAGVNVNVTAEANSASASKAESVAQSAGVELPVFEEGVRTMGAALRTITIKAEPKKLPQRGTT